MSKARAKGTTFESALVTYLREHGHPFAERRAMAGTLDKGDLTGLGPRYVIEAKAAKRIELGPWLTETEIEVSNAKADYGFLIVKLPRRSIAKCAVLITVEQMARIIEELESK